MLEALKLLWCPFLYTYISWRCVGGGGCLLLIHLCMNMSKFFLSDFKIKCSQLILWEKNHWQYIYYCTGKWILKNSCTGSWITCSTPQQYGDQLWFFLFTKESLLLNRLFMCLHWRYSATWEHLHITELDLFLFKNSSPWQKGKKRKVKHC